MSLPRTASRFLLGVFAVGWAALLPRLPAEEVPAPASPPATSPLRWDFFRFIDELPDTVSDLLPNKKPSGALRLYLRPRYGDLIHRDYLRVPLGAQWQATDQLEFTGELQNYFTHGLGHSAGYGFSGLLLGAKCEHLLPVLESGGISLGLNFSTPLSRPPSELSDGYRHLLPYLAATRPLLPQWQVLGYATLGADLLDRTALPPHFGRNELHANSLVLTAGAAREWPHFHGAFTVSLASSALMSDERRQVFSMGPEVVVPVRPATARTQVLLTLGSHATWGPDGHDLNFSSSVRIESQLTGAGREARGR